MHVSDLVAAIPAALDNTATRQNLFNIAMNSPVDYGAIAARLAETRDLASVRVETPFHSNWLDNSKARLTLGWAPKINLERMVDDAFAYVRAKDDPRKVWYVG